MHQSQPKPPARSRLARRGLRSISFAPLAIIASLAFLATPALAVEGHVYSKAFGGGELALESKSALALDQDDGELYVADTGNSRVAKYTAAGLPDGTFATLPTPTFLAVDNSAGASNGDVYVVNTNRSQISKFDPAGTLVADWGTGGVLGGLGSIAGIATDPDGNLWVLNTEALLRQLSPSGTQLSQSSPKELFGKAAPQGIAVDSEQNLYAARGFEGGPFETSEGAAFTKAGNTLVFLYQGTTPVGALAVNSVDGDAYIASKSDSCATGVGRFHRPSTPVVYFEPFEKFGYKCDTAYDADAYAGGASGIAVRESTSEVFVAANGVIKDYVVEDIAPPIVSVETPTAVTTTTAHVVGHINPHPPSGSPPSYDVAWKFSCAPKSCNGSKGEILADDQEHTVESALEGLEPGTKYSVTLAASNSLNSATASVTFKTAPVAPQVLEQYVTQVMPTEADLNAAIKPRGAPTTYHFEYVPEAAFLAEGFASPETRSTLELGPIDEEASEEEVSARVAGLLPDTAYRFRVVATNSVAPTTGLPASFRTQLFPFVAETDCPNQAFRSGAGALLPDCRAYEQASPVDKAGLGTEGFLDHFTAASDGSSVTFFSQSGTGIPASGGAHQEFATMLSSRNGEFWSTQRLLPPESLGRAGNFLGASADLRYALIQSCKGSGTDCGLFLEDTRAQTYTEMVPSGASKYAYASISTDGSRVFFETVARLTPEAAANKGNLYMWDRASGEVSLVGVLPGATPKGPPGGSFGGAYQWTGEKAGPDSGGALAGLYVEAIHAISAEGDRAYFTAGQTGQIYLRRNLTGPNPSTVQVSAPEAGVTDPNGTKPAAFQEATPDGSRAFFLSSQKLTKDATTGPLDNGADLYRYDAATKTLVDVTPDPAVTDPDGAEVQGLLGVSNDGTSGYFAAKGVLAPGATAGSNNIYRFEEESGGGYSYVFVATGGRQNWSPTSSGVIIDPASENFKSSRVTPDARTLVYTAESPTSRGCSKSGKAPCRELYVYSVDRGEPICASCNPTGDRSFGDATLSTSVLNAHLVPGGPVKQHLTRNLTADGMRLVFQSPDPLVAADTNASSGCTYYANSDTLLPDCVDVYEWEAPGAPGGSCKTAEVNGGCLYLLSTGKSKLASNFIDMSADGKDIFIATASPLVPVDRDDLFDVYDVGVGRGSAAQQVGPTTPCVSGEACRGAGTIPPVDPLPGTATFQGPGNPKEASRNKRKRCGKSARKRCGKSKKGTQRKKHQKKQGKRRVNSTKAGGSK